MNYSIPSLENIDAALEITSGFGSRTGDWFIETKYADVKKDIFHSSPMVCLDTHVAARGTFGKDPLYDACQSISKQFKTNSGTVLEPAEKLSCNMFEFNKEDVIVFLPKKDLPGVSEKRLDLIRSKSGFIGIRTDYSYKVDDINSPIGIVWLAGRMTKANIDAFGEENMKYRNKLFGRIYNLAKSGKMQNPLQPNMWWAP